MSRRKGLLLICIISLVMMSGILFFGVTSGIQKQHGFEDAGYVLSTVTVEGESVLSVQYFADGTRYQSNRIGKLSFLNTSGDKVYYDNNQLFTHYLDGGIGTICEGIILDLIELDKGFLNLYYITPQSILSKDANGYAVTSGTYELHFGALLWKISDNKFMVSGGAPKIIFPNQQSIDVSSFVEIEYLDDGIIRYIDDQNVYQTISAGAWIEYPNGTKIDLEKKRIITTGNKQTIDMNDLRIESEDAIVISEPIVLPEFNINTVDGTEGAKGQEGKIGTSGKKGAIGTTGETGSDGANGDAGVAGSSSGAGATGARGASGASGDESVVTRSSEIMPTFILSDTLAVTETSITGSIEMETEDTDNVLVHESTNNKVCLVDAETGILVAESQADYSIFMENSFQFTGLKPNTKYRLILKYQYELERSGVSGVREFLSKVIYTDSIGLDMVLANTDTNTAVISVTKNEWSSAENFYLQYTKPDGTQIRTSSIVCTLDDKFRVELIGLDPDTKYQVELVASNGVGRNTLDFMTLKRKPIIDLLDGVRVLANARGYFEFNFTGTIEDVDAGIASYYYDIYEVDGSNNLQYVKSISNESGSSMALQVDGIQIFRGQKYIAKGYIVFNDNYKNNVYELGESNSFIMRENGVPVVSFTPSRVNYDSIYGTIRFDTMDCNISISSAYPLTVHVYADGVYENTLTFREGSYVAQGSVEVNLDALKRDTEYAFMVSGYAMVNGTNYSKCTWGSFRVSTGSPNRISIIMQEDLDGTSAVNAKLLLGNTSTINSLEYKGLTCIEIQMQNQSGQVLGTSYLVLDEDESKDVSSISDTYWGTDTYIRLNENSFGLSAASLSGLQKVKFTVKAIYDYTYSDFYRDNNINISGYINKLDYTEETSFIEVEKVKTPPSLPTGAYMNVVSIQNMAVSAYRTSTTPDNTLKEDTIVGYSLTPAYSNDSYLAEVVHYYVYDAEEFRKFLSENNSELSNATYPNVETGVVSLGAKKVEPIATYKYGTLGTKLDKTYLPQINLLFGDGDTTLVDENSLYTSSSTRRILSSYMGNNCKRGREYFFAYCVEWKRESGPNYVYPYSHTNYDPSQKFGPSCLLQSTGVKVDGIKWEANRQEPQFYFYPYDSGIMDVLNGESVVETGVIQWMYKVDDPDHALASYYMVDGNWDLMAKSISTGGVTNNIRFKESNDYTIQLSGEDHTDYETIMAVGLTQGQTAVIYKRQCLLYNKLSNPIEQVSQVFDGEFELTPDNLSINFERLVDIDGEKNQFNITLTSNLPSSQSLDRVTMLGVLFKTPGGVPYSEELTYLRITEYENNTIKAELPFSSFPSTLLAAIANSISAISIKPEVYVFYDTGVSGVRTYKDSRVNNTHFPTYPMALQMCTDGTVAKEEGQYQTIKNSAAGVTLSTTGSTNPTNALLLGTSNITVAGNTYFVTVSSSIDPSISRTIGYNITEHGAEIISQDANSTGLYSMPKEIQHSLSMIQTGSELSIEGMKPTLSAMNANPGLFSAKISFQLDNGSFAIIKNASGGNGSYWIRYWKVDDPLTVYTKKFDLVDEDTQHLEINDLIKATAYKYEIYYQEITDDGVVEKKILDAIKNAPVKYTFITQNRVAIAISNIAYSADSYLEKHVTTYYSLDPITGYQLAYILRDNTAEVTYDSRTVNSPMTELMDAESSVGAESKLKLDANPGSIFVNGHTYTMKILAYTIENSETVELGTAQYDFAIPTANEPAFVVRGIPSTSGTENRLTIYIVGADNSKTLVSRDKGGTEVAEYCIRLTDMVTNQLVNLRANSSLTTSTYGVTYDDTRDLFFVDMQTARSKAFTVRYLESDRNYLLEIFAVKDLLNEGDITPLYSQPIPCSTSNLVKAQTLSTMNEYGIKVGTMRADISGPTITLRFGDSVCLEKITNVMYTITNLDDGSVMPISSQIPKVGDNPLLIQNPTIASTYTIAIPKPNTLVTDTNYAITVALRIDSTTVATVTDTFWY